MLVHDVLSYDSACNDLMTAFEASKDGVEVTIKAVRATRSYQQHKFMFVAVVIPVAECYADAGCTYTIQGIESPYDEVFIHELSKRMLPINPETEKRYTSTTQLSVKEFIDYIDKITAHWSEQTNNAWELDGRRLREHRNRKQKYNESKLK